MSFLARRFRQQTKSNTRRIRTSAPPPAAPPMIYFLLLDDVVEIDPSCVNTAVGVGWSVSVDRMRVLEMGKLGVETMVEEEAGRLGVRVVSVPSVCVVVGRGLFDTGPASFMDDDDGTGSRVPKSGEPVLPGVGPVSTELEGFSDGGLGVGVGAGFGAGVELAGGC
jgi:hypothetical protein